MQPLNTPPNLVDGPLVEALKLVKINLEIRQQRRAGASDEKIRAATTACKTMRRAWWSRAQRAHSKGDGAGGHPLAKLQARLGLRDEEVDILVVVLAAQIEPDLRDAIIHARAEWMVPALTADAILGLLFHDPAERLASRRLLTPTAPLARHGLLSVQPRAVGMESQDLEIRPTEALMAYALGRSLDSGPLSRYCELVSPLHDWSHVVLPEDDKQKIWELVAGTPRIHKSLDGWGYARVMPRARGLVLLFAGPPGTGKTMLAHAIANRLRRPILRIHTSRLLTAGEHVRGVLSEALSVASMSEAVALLEDCESLLDNRNPNFLALLECLDDHDGVLLLTTNNPTAIDFAMERRIQSRIDFVPPDVTARAEIWMVHLPPEAPMASDVDVETLASAYEISGARIRNAVMLALAKMEVRGTGALTMELLREASDAQLAGRLDDLAQRSTQRFGLDRLVLAEPAQKKLNEVVAACRHREKVLGSWGFGDTLSTGKGLCILFDGPPGTGKTFTAEILAHELKLPLYRVHIPNVVSKWVGETERNIAAIFQQARSARALLLFDEADALFGKRTEVTSANDRFANMEVNLLLQEIERYDGITFLTTNLYSGLDSALQRRIQYRVSFPAPGVEERERIWRVLCPAATPVGDDVDFEELAEEYDLSGGYIKNALLRAAYLACEDGERLEQRHLKAACRAQLESLGRVVREYDDD